VTITTSSRIISRDKLVQKNQILAVYSHASNGHDLFVLPSPPVTPKPNCVHPIRSKLTPTNLAPFLPFRSLAFVRRLRSTPPPTSGAGRRPLPPCPVRRAPRLHTCTPASRRPCSGCGARLSPAGHNLCAAGLHAPRLYARRHTQSAHKKHR
jgi:hypothetical protein